MLDKLSIIPASFYTNDKKRLSTFAYSFLVLLCIAFFIPGIVTLPPTDRDESSFAQASKQMIESGNYVDIRLQDKPRYKKPVGIYWLQAASAQFFSPHHLNEIWSYRLPSLFGATLSVLMTAAIGSLLFGPLTGLLAAMMMAGCVILNVEARLAKTDAALLGSIMVAQYALARAYMRKSCWQNALLFWTALGIGILIKGPIIILVLFSTLIWLRISDKNLKWFKDLKPVIGFFYMLMLVSPWFIAIITHSQGTFIEQSATHDLLAKVWQGQDRGIMPPGLHLLAFPVVFFPFALFAWLGLPDTWKNRHLPAVKFCLGWIIPTWIVFELSLTKLPHYVLPTYPAIALLAAKALLDGYPELMKREWRWVMALLIGFWLMTGTGLAVVFAFIPYLSDHSWSSSQIIAGALLILAQGACLFLLFQRKPGSIAILVVGSLFFMTSTFGIMLPPLQHLWVSRQVVETAELIKPCQTAAIVSAAYREPSLVFLAGTNTEIMNDGRLAIQRMSDNPCLIGLIDEAHRDDFLNQASKSNLHPLRMSTVERLNTGYGKTTPLELYVLPQQ